MKKWLIAVSVSLTPALLLAESVKPAVDVPGIVSGVSKGVLDVILPVVIGLIGWGVKRGLDLIKMSFIRSLARKWVMSAFQQFDDNKERYGYVAKKIHAAFKFLSEEEIKDYIEEAVAQLKIELSKIEPK